VGQSCVPCRQQIPVDHEKQVDTKRRTPDYHVHFRSTVRATTSATDKRQKCALRPILLFNNEITMFPNGTSLFPYQSADLKRLLDRERGEIVCGERSDAGYILAYDMGQVHKYRLWPIANLYPSLGKTIVTLAMVCAGLSAIPHGSLQPTLWVVS